RGLVVNPLDGEREHLPEADARGLLPRRVAVVSAEEPEAKVEALLDTFLGPANDAAWIRRLDSRVLSRERAGDDDPAGMLARDVRAREQAANLRENQAWSRVAKRDEWEAFREPRLRALRDSLRLPEVNPEPPRMRVTRVLEGDGFRIEDLVFE